MVSTCGEKDVGKWGGEANSIVAETDGHLDTQPVAALLVNLEI